MAVQLILLIAFILILGTLFNTILLKSAAISHVRDRLHPRQRVTTCGWSLSGPERAGDSSSTGQGSKLLSIFLILPYTIDSWIIFPVALTALRRTVLGHSTWAKTAREPLVDGVHAQVTADPQTHG